MYKEDKKECDAAQSIQGRNAVFQRGSGFAVHACLVGREAECSQRGASLRTPGTLGPGGRRFDRVGPPKSAI